MCFVLLHNSAFAQQSEYTFSGTLIEAKTKQPVPYATVALYDSISKNVIKGTISQNDGSFSLQTSTNQVFLQISFMGFETQTINQFTVANNTIDLGTITLTAEAAAIDAVIVTGEVSKTVFKLDKRVFNVGKDLSTTGASALEVLNNVPSVNVGIEGNISLRGSSGVQILINGKPSVLADESSNALGTITADMIESIEIITNPSAKYDASGTAGILNIVLKKEEKEGWNGSISLNTGMPDNHSLGFSVNRRTEKFNLFSQLGAGYRSLPRIREAKNVNYVSGETIASNGTEYRNETFFNITLGTDYHINDYNVLTLSGNFAYEIEDQPSDQNFQYLDSNGQLISDWTRNEFTEATNPKFQYELNYNKQFKKNKEHVLQLSALGRFFAKDLASQFTTTTLLGNEVNNNQQTESDFLIATYTFKLDYTNPITKQITLESGAQYDINDAGNDFSVKDYTNNEYVINEALTNNFEYLQGVFGVYTTAAYEKEKWGAKGGLRFEQTSLTTLLTNTNQRNSQNFGNFFPSFHTSYKFKESFSLQAGYSRRINRPNLWNLNPFYNVRNNFNIRIGNPNLLPEFTNSYELTSIYKIGKASFSSSLFHRFTEDVVERISTIEESVTFSKPENIGTNSTVGFETNGKYSPKKWLTLTGDFNYNYFSREGSFQNQLFDFKGSQWTSMLGTKLALPYGIDIEFNGNYRSRYVTVQGDVTGYAFLDMGVRKKIFKGKAIVNLSVRDVFRSRISESFVYQPNFESYDFSQRGRFITLGLSYGFGKGEAMTYSGGRRH